MLERLASPDAAFDRPLNEQRIEEFRKSYDKAMGDLENLHLILLDNRTVRASESTAALKSCQQLYGDVQKFLSLVMDGGK